MPPVDPRAAGGTDDRPDIAAELESLRARLVAAERYLRLDELRTQLVALESDVAAPDLWNDSDHAREVTTAYGRVKGDIELLEGLAQRLDDACVLLELTSEEGAG